MRKIRVDGDTAYIPLTRGYEAVIDAADAPLVGGFTWSALVTPRSVYAYRTDCSGGKQRGVLMHRLLMGDPAGAEVDHQNGDGLLNRRNNLRTATKQQNQHNARTRTDNTSGSKGVTRDSGNWTARIMIDRKRKYLGSFKCPTTAHLAYAKASKEVHGEFGRIG